jgi:protein-S-isoprenylcysteine O-methyltransferase Ste14
VDEKTFLMVLFTSLVLLEAGLGNWAARRHGAKLPRFYTKAGAKYAWRVLEKGGWVIYALTLLIVGLMANAYAALWNGAYSLPLVGAGFVLILAATWVNYLGKRDLAKNFVASTSTTRGQTLVTTGIFARVRHPVYLGFVLLDAGMALVAVNAAGAALFALSVVGLVLRARKEEEELVKKFGKKYADYAKRVPGFVPRS